MVENKNQIFLTLDSLRWDVFKNANLPFLKSLGCWKKAYTPANYTLPAHMSFFMGKLPQTLDKTDYYDSTALHIEGVFKKKYIRKIPFWRLINPESGRDSKYQFSGANIIQGFKDLGYFTVGSGAASWFNNELAPGKYLTEDFDVFSFFDGPDFQSLKSAKKQVHWAKNNLANLSQPYFLFINFGETHHKFIYEGCDWEFDKKNPYGNRKECLYRQMKCIEFLDREIESLLSGLTNYELIICSDHGEAMGESGLWGHGFHHKTIVEVPLLISTE